MFLAYHYFSERKLGINKGKSNIFAVLQNIVM